MMGTSVAAESLLNTARCRKLRIASSGGIETDQELSRWKEFATDAPQQQHFQIRPASMLEITNEIALVSKVATGSGGVGSVDGNAGPAATGSYVRVC